MAAYGICVRLLSKKKLFPTTRVVGFQTSFLSNTRPATSLTSTPPSVDNKSEIPEGRPFHEIPGPRGLYRMPYLGFLLHLKPFTNHSNEMLHRVFGKLIDQFGPVVRINLQEPAVIISDCNDIEKMFQNEGKNPFRPPNKLMETYYRRSGKKLDVTNVNGEEWYHLRSTINKHLLRPHSMIHYLPEQNKVADDFVKLLAQVGHNYNYPSDNGPFFWFAAESVGVVLFNARVGFLTETAGDASMALIKATSHFFITLGKTATGSFLFKFFEDKIYKQFKAAYDLIEEETNKYIVLAKKDLEIRKKNGTYNPKEPNLLLNLLNDDNLVEEDVVNIMKSMYAAGVDSTGCTLQSSFYLLATNPDKQDKLREEVHRVMGRDNPLTKENLSNMPYLKACLKESYRCMYPICGGSTRKLPIDTVLGGYNIPAGVRIFFFNMKLLREGFDQPDEFIPERWLRGEDKKQKESQHSAWALLPFSFGPRGCVGKRVAEQEMCLALAKTVQKLKIGLEPESWGIPFDYTIFVKPRKLLKFTFTEI